MYIPPTIYVNIDEAIQAYKNSLPWEGDRDRAFTVLGALEYIILLRPTRTQLSSLATDFESLKSELDRVREFLGVNVKQYKSKLQAIRSTGVM